MNHEHRQSSAHERVVDAAIECALDDRFAPRQGTCAPAAPPMPALLLGHVTRRRRARQARAGGSLAIVLAVAAGTWFTLKNPAPRTRVEPVVAQGSSESQQARDDLHRAMALRARPMGSGVYAAVVARAGDRPGSATWRNLLEQ